jgi:hypothetical protein
MSKLRLLGLFSLSALGLSLFTGCGSLEMPALANLGPASSTYSSARHLQTLQISRMDTSLGQQIAATASSQAPGGTGYCYQYVAQALHVHFPIFLSGLHAYLAADQLAANPAFEEVSVAASDLPNLPAGAVVVWDKGSSESGHISIANGQGYEISDHLALQMTSHYGGGGYRVFVPLKGS